MDPIEAFGRVAEGVGSPFLTDGWRWANTRCHLVAHRARAADAPDRVMARVSALLKAPLGEREYSVALLRAFGEAHMPAPQPCAACDGSGWQKRTCHHCDHVHNCPCDCDGGMQRPFGDGSVIGVGGVPFRAAAFLSVVRWLEGLGVSTVRVTRVAAVTAGYDGPALVLGTDAYRCAVSAVSQEAVSLLVPCAEEFAP